MPKKMLIWFILVRSRQSNHSSCFPDVPEGVSFPFPIFTWEWLSQDTRNKIKQASDVLNACKGEGCAFPYLCVKVRNSARLPLLLLIQTRLQRHIIKMGRTEFHRKEMKRPPGKTKTNKTLIYSCSNTQILGVFWFQHLIFTTRYLFS